MRSRLRGNLDLERPGGPEIFHFFSLYSQIDERFNPSAPRMYFDNECTASSNACASNPCQHGTCTQQMLGTGTGAAYTCDCPDGFDGDNCENAQQTVVVTTAIAVFAGTHDVWGGVRLVRKGASSTELTVNLQGVNVALGGWHVHSSAIDGDDTSCASAGGHYSSVWDLPAHAFALPTGIPTGGIINITGVDHSLTLDDVVGRSIVIHRAGKTATKYLCATIQPVDAGAVARHGELHEDVLAAAEPPSVIKRVTQFKARG